MQKESREFSDKLKLASSKGNLWVHQRGICRFIHYKIMDGISRFATREKTLKPATRNCHVIERQILFFKCFSIHAA